MSEDGIILARSWVQGSALPQELSVNLGLLRAEEVNKVWIVVSHDCDLIRPSSIEPYVELVFASIDPPPNAGYRHAKSPRTLQLDALKSGETRVLQLSATTRKQVEKGMLAGWQPDPSFDIRSSQKTLALLRRWLSVRYNRSAYPDSFNERLQSTGVRTDIEKCMKRHPQITAVYGQINTYKELGPEGATPYLLDLVLAYEPGDDPEEAALASESAAEEIQTAFENRCLADGKWNKIELRSCLSISEDDLTVSQARKLTQIYFDYLTFRTDKEVSVPY